MIKLYVTILNLGVIRSEHVTQVLPRVFRTNDVKVVFEDLTVSQNVPLANNRAMIRKRFLETNCDNLLMLDEDVVPDDNPAELALCEKDIIGCPYLIWKKQVNRLVWTAWVDYDGYRDIDIDTIENPPDLMPVDVIGLGCSVISRRVLEKITFEESYCDNGVLEYGEEFALCRRAKEFGFGIFTTPKRKCEHYKNVGLKVLKESLSREHETETVIR